MNNLTVHQTKERKPEQKSDRLSRLASRRQVTIRALAAGKTITAAAKELGIGRTTVHAWLKQPDFREALDEEMMRLRDDGSQLADEVAAFEAAERTPLLSLAGIRARLELLDRLVISDLRNQSDKRRGMIGRLEASIDQANAFLQKVTANEAASSLLEQRMEAYRRALLDVLIELLEPLSVSKKVMTAIRLRLEDVDQEAGVSL